MPKKLLQAALGLMAISFAFAEVLAFADCFTEFWAGPLSFFSFVIAFIAGLASLACWFALAVEFGGWYIEQE